MAEGLQPGLEKVAALRAALAAAELRADAAEARASVVEAKASSDAALIAHLKLEIAKLKRAQFARPPSVASACWTSTSCSWRSWRRPPPSTS